MLKFCEEKLTISFPRQEMKGEGLMSMFLELIDRETHYAVQL